MITKRDIILRGSSFSEGYNFYEAHDKRFTVLSNVAAHKMTVSFMHIQPFKQSLIAVDTPNLNANTS